MRIELHIRVDEGGPDWEGMGMKKPRNYKPPVVQYKRRTLYEADIWYIEEYTDEETTVRISYEENPVIVKGSYEEIASLITIYEDEEEGAEPDLVI